MSEDTERLAQLEAALAAECERRNVEWARGRVEAGRVVQLIAERGVTVADAVARRRAEFPDEDCWYIVYDVYDGPLPRSDTPTPSPPPSRPDVFGEADEKARKRFGARRLVYTPTGWS
jgi:hypothetical protein